MLHFGAQGVPKEYPLDGISVILGVQVEIQKQWFRVHATTIFKVGGVPRDPRSLLKSTSKKRFEQTAKKHKNVRKFVPKGTPLGDQKVTKNQLFHDFFDLAPSGVPWEGPGLPKDPQGHQEVTKKTPK